MHAGGGVNLRHSYLPINSSDSHAGVADARSASALRDDRVYSYLLGCFCAALTEDVSHLSHCLRLETEAWADVRSALA